MQKLWTASAYAKTSLSPSSPTAHWHPTVDNWLELLLGGDQQVHQYKSHEETEVTAVLNIYQIIIKKIGLFSLLLILVSRV